MSSPVLTRRRLLLGAAAALPLAAKKPARPRPNIVLVLADGLGAWALGCYGSREIRTPNLDLLARSGTRFAYHIAASGASGPARQALFTGAAPARATNAPMLSDALAAQGYRCGFAGVWDLGGGAGPQHGFTSWYALADPPAYRGAKVNRDGETVEESGYLPERITAQALKFLDGARPGSPFLLVVSHLNPAPPYEGHPQKYSDMYASVPFTTTGWEPGAANAAEGRQYLKDIVGTLRRAAAGVTALDDQVPPLLAKLDERGVRDNTVVIFTAPSGSLMGRHGLWGDGNASDPPNLYEEVVSVPLIWNWRGSAPPEATRPELVSTCDLVPTLCDAAGAAPPAGICGRSYLPAVLSRPFPKKQPWQGQAFAEMRDVAMTRDERFKLVLRNQGKGPNELYALRTDPGEKANQYNNASFISVRDQFTADLEGWRKRCG